MIVRSLLLVFLLAGCTNIGEQRWAAHEPEAEAGTLDAIPKSDRAASGRAFGFTSAARQAFEDSDNDGLPDRTAIPTLGFLFDQRADGAPSEEGIPFQKPIARTKARKMIYSAGLQVQVSSIPDAVKKFLDRVVQLEGYLALRNNNTLTCRVPVKNFQTLIQEVKHYGTVLRESMRAQDVTKKHIDLSIRLENAEKARQRLLKLIDKATKVEDILKIEEQLTRLTETIERIKGELKYLNEQVAFSMVEVGFQSVAPAVRPSKKRSRSRFAWINQVGIEQVLRRF